MNIVTLCVHVIQEEGDGHCAAKDYTTNGVHGIYIHVIDC